MAFSYNTTTFNEPTSGTRTVSVTLTRTDTTNSEQAYFQVVNGSYSNGYGTATDADFDFSGSNLTYNSRGLHYGYYDFAPGQSSITITFGIVGGDGTEGTETFTLYAGHNGGTGNNSYIGQAGNATITENADSAGTLTIGSPTVSEGDAGTTNLVYSISRSGGTGDIDFTLATDNTGTATAGSDYTAVSQNFSYRSGVLYANNNGTLTAATGLTVVVNGDTGVEGNETVNVSLFNAPSTLFYSGGAGTILNDDARYTITSPSVAERNSGTTPLTFTVTRDTSGFATTLYAVPFSNSGPNGATAGEDFSSAVQAVSFAANETSKTFTILVNGDTKIENTETFGVNLFNSNAGGAYSVFRAAATGTITNDDFVPNDTTSPRYLVSEGIEPTTLTGASGSDIYVVANPQTTIVDGPNGGNDTVYVSTAYGLTTYALSGGAFIETISAQEQQGTDPLNLTGNFYAQTLIGNNGPNILNGNGGADTLIGLGGDDTYAISDASAVIVEQPGQGYDRVYTSVSYTLTGTASVEELGFTNQSGTENLNLIGNAFDQKLVGNYGDNVLNGNGGVDTLIGLLGNDTYVVGDARTVVVENAGEGFDTVYANTSYALAAGASIEVLSTATQGGTEAYNLTGNELAQKVIGNNGDNVIDGGAGADTLTGLGGADTFRFSSALGNGNVDTITDFGNGADRISLSASVFGGMATGTLSATNFVVGTAAATADQHIIYNQATGQLFYDADGSGAGAAILFATLTPGTQLTATMITVA